MTTIDDTPRRPRPRTVGGITYDDPYAWLEDESDETLAWQRAQTDATLASLAAWPHTERLREQAAAEVAQLFTFAPLHRGPHWFLLAFHASGATVDVSDSPAGEGRILVDPQAIADGREDVSLDWFFPSPLGTFVAFGLSFGGDEQSVLHVIETRTERLLPERIPFTSIATVSWLPDESGFFYNAGHAPDWEDADKQLFFHALEETEQREPEALGDVRDAYCVVPQVSPNGRWLLAVTSEVDPRADHVRELPDGAWRPFLLDVPGRGNGVFDGDDYIAIMTDGAPRGRLVRVPVRTSDDRSTWRELVPESEGVIRSVEVVGGHLVVCDLVDACARLRLFDLEGRFVEEVALPGRGTVLQTPGLNFYLTAVDRNVSAGEDDFTFVFSTFTRSPALYLYSVTERTLTELEPPAFEHRDLVVSEETARAPDGAAVRYRVVRRADVSLEEARPTLIYGYGGWNIAWIPGYLTMFVPFVRAGGVFVFAHLRGGGEFGADFWDDGRLGRKQHTYDDLYAVAEDLLERGWTARELLGVVGASNGGLLTGVAVTQRPDLWRVVCSKVPLYDMLTFTRDGYTATCTLEYGDPSDPEDANVLLAYSPYHNVREGTRYPATLVYCGANDMRCLPWHGRKLVASMQAANAVDRPIRLRVADPGGHLTVMLDPSQVAEWLGFVMRELGLEPA